MDARTSRALPVMLALGCTWGASFLFIKLVVDETGPLEVVLGRLLFGTIAVAGYVLVTRHPMKLSLTVLAQVSVLALFANLIPFGLIAWGQEHITSGTAAILNSTVPIFTAAIAAAVLDEEYFTRSRLGGLVLGVLGVAVLTGDGALDLTDSSVLGEIAIVGAALCYGGGAVLSRQLLRAQDPVNLAMIQLSLGTVYAVPLLLVGTGGAPDFNVSLEAWGAIVALGIGGTGLGYIAFLWLIETLGSVRASLVTYIVPVVAVILGWVVLDESIGVNTIVGGVLIVGGVAVVMRGNIPARRELPGSPRGPIPNEAEAAPAAAAVARD